MRGGKKSLYLCTAFLRAPFSVCRESSASSRHNVQGKHLLATPPLQIAKLNTKLHINMVTALMQWPGGLQPGVQGLSFIASWSRHSDPCCCDFLYPEDFSYLFTAVVFFSCLNLWAVSLTSRAKMKSWKSDGGEEQVREVEGQKWWWRFPRGEEGMEAWQLQKWKCKDKNS